MTEVAAVPPKSKYWNEEKQCFEITTSLKDEQGNSVGPLQYFSAPTMEELLEKKDAAHANAALKLYETRKANRLGTFLEPDKDTPLKTFEERPLTADERVKITKALNDPATTIEAFKSLSEAVYGASPEDIRSALQQIEVNKQVERIQYAIQEFKNDHPEYVESASNRDNLLKYIEKKKWSITKKNLEIAFADLLRDELIVVRAPKVEEPKPAVVAPVTVAAAPAEVAAIPPQPTNPAPVIPEVPTEVRPRQSSSGLSRSDSTAAPGTTTAPKTVGITIRDINRMSAKEYQDKLRDPEFRKQVEALYAKK